jgi:hypothetical protein
MVIDFFALRPVFTMWGLRLVWILVLAQQAVFIASAFSTYGRFSWRSSLMITSVFVSMALHLFLVRLLIEVAAAILQRPPPLETRSPSNRL